MREAGRQPRAVLDQSARARPPRPGRPAAATGPASWSTTIVVALRSAVTRATASRTRAAPGGSSCAVGSSSSSRPGRRASTPARTSRCFSPPESACGRAVAAVGEADGGQRRVDPRPDLVGGQAGVLQTEGDVVPGPGHDELAVRVLGEQAQPAPGGARCPAVHGELAGHLGALGVQDAGEGGEQRGLAGARGAGQEHPLAGLDDEVDAGQRPGPPRGMADAEPPGDDAGRCPSADARALSRTGDSEHELPEDQVWSPGSRDQTRVRPAANELSAPVRARARTSSRPTTPASSTLEITVNTVYGSVNAQNGYSWDTG